jgi:hypothetical protein
MRLRDVAIGLQAQLVEANYQRGKVELSNTQLRKEIHYLNERLGIAESAHGASRELAEKALHDISLRDAELVALRKSHTWRIGSLALAPVRWLKRSKS